MNRARIRFLSVLLLALPGTACTGAGGGGPASEPAPPSADRPSLDRLEALYRARQDSVRMRVSEADVAFMEGMIGHHAQALVMSAWAPSHAASPSIRTLAARITNAQKDEIALMQRWLRERDRRVPEVGPGGHVMGHDMHMPGMLTPAQLEELEGARGETFDRLYLTYMIQHHEGAVTMVDDLFASDGAAQDDFVFKLASDIQVDQTTEVARMRRMLEALP